MARVGTDRSGHSASGIASFVLAVLPAVMLAAAAALIFYLTRNAPSGRDQTAYGFGLIMLSLLALLMEFAALGLGIAGLIQRSRKRTFALVGVVCSVLVLVWLNFETDLARFVLGIPELFDPVEMHYRKSPPEG